MDTKHMGDVTNRPSKATNPQDHVAHNLQGLPTEKYKGQGLGTEPIPTPQTGFEGMGGAAYPGQELGV
jgi:hypothetical protein